MSPSIALRLVRHLSTTTTTPKKPISISQTKSQLKKVLDPVKTLQIYTSFTSTNSPTTSRSSARHAQEQAVRRLAKSHRFSEIQTFLESHKSNPQITDEQYVSSLIRSYGSVGMFDNALKTYEEMPVLGAQRTAFSFNALLHACIHSKEYERVPVLFAQLPGEIGFKPDTFSYGILIKAYCEMGMPEIAVEKLGEMEGSGFEVTEVVFTTILNGLYKMKGNEEAEKFWDLMVNEKGVKPNVGSYNVRIRFGGGKPEDVKAIIEEMSSAGVKPDTITYNYLMTSYCENEMLDEAKEVFYDILKSKGCNPNAASFRTLVFHLCKKGRHMTGYKVFKESVKMHKIPDFNTLKYLVEGLVNQGHTLTAREMVRTVYKKFPDDLLKGWRKVVEDLGLAEEEEEPQVDKKVDTDEKVESEEIEKVSA